MLAGDGKFEQFDSTGNSDIFTVIYTINHFTLLNSNNRTTKPFNFFVSNMKTITFQSTAVSLRLADNYKWDTKNENNVKISKC